MQARRRVAPVVHGDADEKIVGVGLGILDADVEVAAIVEDAGIGELELGLGAPASAVFLHEPSVGILRLRILVERAHVGVCGRGVEIEVAFLDVLAVIALVAGQAEEPLLEDGIPPVPEGEGEAETLMVIRDPEQPILAPPIDARARMIVREVFPGRPGRRVVLAHRAPLACREVGSPPAPVRRARPGLGEPSRLSRHAAAGPRNPSCARR